MKWFRKNIFYFAWAQALVATLGSLYFSEIKHFNPCVLCWYQRILMYPLVIIIGVGILRQDKNLPYYVLPLSILGAVIAFYHNYLQPVAPRSLTPCTFGISCSTQYINWFGFITIPFLSLTAFTVITVLMIIFLKLNKSK